MTRMRMNDFTHGNESCHTCEWVMSHMWMSHITHMNERCHTCEWVMSHMWMSHVTHANEWWWIFIGKVVFICLRVSVNLVYKFQGKPGTTTVKHDFNPNGLKFHRGSPWVSILSWLNLKANKDYFSYEYDEWWCIWCVMMTDDDKYDKYDQECWMMMKKKKLCHRPRHWWVTLELMLRGRLLTGKAKKEVWYTHW